MVKLVCLISRPPQISAADFRRWWLEHHAGIAARLPALRRYTISLPEGGGDAAPFDGVAELWFDSEEAMALAFASPAGEECSREDRELVGGRIAFVTREHVIV